MDGRTPSGLKFRSIARPTNDTVPTLKQYTNVIDQFNQLLVEYRELDRRTTEREISYRELKKALRDWDKYLQRKHLVPSAEQRHDAAQRVTPLGPGISPIPTEELAEGLHVSERTPRPILSPRLLHTAHARTETKRDKQQGIRACPAHATLKTTSSQTTQGEPRSDRLNPQDEDDVPEIVSARSLRKNRLPAARHVAGQHFATHDGTPARPLAIKEESRSSHVSAPLEPPPLMRTETADLDHVVVPDRTVFQHIHNSLPGSTHTQSDGSRNSRTPIKVDPAVEESQSREPDLPVLTDLLAGRGPASTQSSGPLQPLSVNTPTLPRSSAAQTNKSGTWGKGRGARAIHVLSEDGSESSRSSKRIKLSSDDEPARQFSKAKLSHLLEGAADTPSKIVLSPVANRQPRLSAVRPTNHAIKQQKPQQTHTPVSNKSPAKTKRLDVDDPRPALPEHEPLRSRPLHRLSIDDFKINPKYSELGYAYSETIRKRDERRCLPGCTKDCCSAFRRMAALGLLPNEPQRRGLFDDPEADVDDEELTLRGYLGQAYAQIIRNASPEEKKQMLIEARTKAFADKHGKHRQIFERQGTPPGFWRTEMPTTQELEEDREEARRQERQKVEERWREAMRGGGRFVFRDE